MKTILYATVLTMAMSLASCEEMIRNPEIITGKGMLVSQTMEMIGFKKIESRINADIQILPAGNSGMLVSCQENLLPFIQTWVINETLVISYGETLVKTDSTITLKIYSPEITELRLTGTGDVTSNLPIGTIILSGLGNISCTGSCENVNVNIMGAGNVDLIQMPVKNANIRISGAGNVSVCVTEKLDANISGIGNIIYKGQPSIRSTIKGIGQIIENK